MSAAVRFPVPDIVRRRAESEGEASIAWLAKLDDDLTSLEQEWGLTIGQALPGGTVGFVAEATDAEGNPFIVKVCSPPAHDGGHEAAILGAAAGKGYARLIRHDEARHAILIEELGESLEAADLPYRTKVDAICATLLQAWMPVPAHLTLPTGEEKANSLAMFILRTAHALGQPCAQNVIETALMYCRDRAAAWRPANAVLAHGDPHPGNTLAVPNEPGHFRFIDPEGLAIEPAYDLGVVLRAWHEGIEGRHAHDIARSHAHHLTTRTQVPAEAIWQWGYIERVSTGLHLMELGEMTKGREFLTVAEAITL
ncbi:aminoglycoside phosphotransferase family protein [Devosia sp. SL43]|uniref:aminoglycoside phosphotransferase family protein n=1 Tax=Devosia sp. SL43 TaxID=2806348 RepID=UPI001F19057A|nr:phosphotransferase [Devosia sp. SL43]UJW87222.1 phosphotransferase [Devosia sp. SL43]